MAEIKNAEPTANNINNFNSARDTLTAAYENRKTTSKKKLKKLPKLQQIRRAHRH